jgi:hypothetical protein
LARFTENKISYVPWEVITWLGRVLWCSESRPQLIPTVSIIDHLANVSSCIAPLLHASYVSSLLHASPSVVPRLAAFITSEDGELANLALSVLTALAARGGRETRSRLVEFGVREAVESYLESSTADPSSKSIGTAALCARTLSYGASSARAAYLVRLLTRHLAALDGNISQEGNRTAAQLFAGMIHVLNRRVKDDDEVMLAGVLQREVLPIAQLFSRNDDLA